MNATGSRSRRHVIDVLFTLALFCVFAAASLIVVFIGADVYSSTVRRMDTSFEVNTTLMFVSTNIRQHDSQGAVRIDELEGRPALVLRQYLIGRIFETWIYHHNGELRELFIDSENRYALSLDAGQSLINVYSFHVEMVQDGLVAIYAESEDGTSGRMLVSLRSSAETPTPY
ncbi:MAG: DUF4860 domain-containing protein [Defluviitaleaceae bacterium]|nr:DUF4860 domain-containing protein [Defluviitaleaceae bacterium]